MKSGSHGHFVKLTNRSNPLSLVLRFVLVLSALFRSIPPHCAQTNTARSASGAEVRRRQRAAPACGRKLAQRPLLRANPRASCTRLPLKTTSRSSPLPCLPSPAGPSGHISHNGTVYMGDTISQVPHRFVSCIGAMSI